MPQTSRQLARAGMLAAIAMLAAASLKTPSLFAQNTGSIQVSVTVLPVAPSREAADQAQAISLRALSVAETPQREVSQRVTTVSRLAQISTERIRAAGNARQNEAEVVRVTVEFAAN